MRTPWFLALLFAACAANPAASDRRAPPVAGPDEAAPKATADDSLSPSLPPINARPSGETGASIAPPLVLEEPPVCTGPECEVQPQTLPTQHPAGLPATGPVSKYEAKQCTEEESRDPNSPCYVPPVRPTEDPAMVRGERGLEPRTGASVPHTHPATDDQLAIDAEQDKSIRELRVRLDVVADYVGEHGGALSSLADTIRTVAATPATAAPWWHTTLAMVLWCAVIAALVGLFYGGRAAFAFLVRVLRRKSHAPPAAP